MGEGVEGLLVFGGQGVEGLLECGGTVRETVSVEGLL